MSIYLTFALALSIITIVQAGRVLLTLYALELGAQPFAVGILAATFSLLPMLFSWQVGKFSDRFGSRWLLMVGTVGGAFGMLLPYGVSGLPAIYIAGVMNGLLFAFSGVCLQNLVGLLSNPKTSAKNFSNYSMLISLTGFIGPLLAGFSVDLSGHAVACLYLVLLSLVPAALLLIWGGTLPTGSRTAHRAGSVRDMLAESGLWRVLATSSLVVTGIDLFQVYVPIYGNEVGLSASAIGIVLAMFSIAAFVVRMALPISDCPHIRREDSGLFVFHRSGEFFSDAVLSERRGALTDRFRIRARHGLWPADHVDDDLQQLAGRAVRRGDGFTRNRKSSDTRGRSDPVRVNRFGVRAVPRVLE